jgi:hypothetical protein
MKYIKKIYESVDIIPEFEHILKGHKKIVINSFDAIKLKIKIGKFKIINHENSSYYQYKGEIFVIRQYRIDGFDIKIFYEQDVLIKDLKDSISKYENRIIEMEDAIQKIKHGGDE